MYIDHLNTGFTQLHGRNLFLRIEKAPATNTRAVILVPPFAEEMNKCRHLLNAAMRQLAAVGYSCFMLDNYGTGDSDGDLDTATTTLWRADLQQLLSKLAAAGFCRVSFIAVRFGALQLFDLLNQTSLALPPEQVILWQPMFDINKFWQQFVRIKVAEAMASGAKISQKELEQQLNSGDSIEIAGYPISPAFYHSLLQLNTAPPDVLRQCRLSWFETSAIDTIAIPVQKTLQQLQQLSEVNFAQLNGEPYWQAAELVSADMLIARTVQQLSTGAQ